MYRNDSAPSRPPHPVIDFFNQDKKEKKTYKKKEKINSSKSNLENKALSLTHYEEVKTKKKINNNFMTISQTDIRKRSQINNNSLDKITIKSTIISHKDRLKHSKSKSYNTNKGRNLKIFSLLRNDKGSRFSQFKNTNNASSLTNNDDFNNNINNKFKINFDVLDKANVQGNININITFI